jgi:hypothetical protein
LGLHIARLHWSRLGYLEQSEGMSPVAGD